MIYHLNCLSIDTSARLLTRHGETVTIPKRAFDCICILIENRDRALCRDEMIQSIWGHENISDNQLSQTVLSARRILGDTGCNQRLIRTVPGIGYHWIGCIEYLEENPSSDGTDPLNTQPLNSEDNPPALVLTLSIWKKFSQYLGSIYTKLSHFKPPDVSLAFSLAAFMLLTSYSSPNVAPTPTSVNSHIDEVVWILPAQGISKSDNAWARTGLISLIGDRLRLSGFKVIPAENVLSVLEDEATHSLNHTQLVDSQYLQEYFNAGLIIEPFVEQKNSEWIVRLNIQLEGKQVAVERSAEQLIKATVDAIDRVVIQLEQVPIQNEDSAPVELLAMKEWFRQGNYTRVRSQLEQLTPQLHSHTEVRLLEAQLAMMEGQDDLAIDQIANVFSDHTLSNNSILHAQALMQRAYLQRKLVQDVNLDDVDHAVRLLEQTQAWPALASALLDRGRFNMRHRQTEDAYLDFIRARELFLDTGDDMGVAKVDYEIARDMQAKGRYLESLEQLESSAVLFKKYSHYDGLARTYQLMIRANSHMARWGNTKEICHKSTELAPYISVHTKERVFRRCSVVSINTGKLSQAEALIQQMENDQTSITYNDKDHLLLDSYRVHLDLAHGEHQRAVEKISDISLRFYTLVASLKKPEQQMKDNLEFMLLLNMLARRSVVNPPLIPEALIDTLTRPKTIPGQFAYGLYLLELDHQIAAEERLKYALHTATQQRYLSLAVTVCDALTQHLIAQGRIEEAQKEFNLLLATDPMHLTTDYTTAITALRIAQAQGRNQHWIHALQKAESLAGERIIPTALTQL